MKSVKLKRIDYLIIFLFAFARLFLGLKYSLGADEAHYALYGMNLDLSYFDHPPLVGWIHFAFQSIFGIHDWVARLPAILIGIVSSVLAFNLVTLISKDTVAARWAVVALNVSFMCFGLFLMFLPDTLLLPLGLWMVFIILDLFEEDSWKNWLLLGLCLGLCGLSKYTAILFVPSLVGIALQEKIWKRWLSWKLLLAVCVAFVCVLPVVYWNWQRNWISFAYQTDHVMGENSYSLENFFSSLVAQIIAYSPFLVVSSFAAVILTSNKKLATRVSLWIIAPCFSFFLYSGLKGFVLPHWSFVAFAILFICGFAEGFARPKLQKLLKISTLLSLGVMVVVLIELFFSVIPFKDYKTAYADLTGWHEVHDRLQKYKLENPSINFSIGVPNWSLGARSRYYFSDVASVFVLDQRFDQFDIWEKEQKPIGDLILIRWHSFEFPWALDKVCRSSKIIDSQVFRKKDYITTSVELILCRDYAPL